MVLKSSGKVLSSLSEILNKNLNISTNIIENVELLGGNIFISFKELNSFHCSYFISHTLP